ncbi:LysE family translocator [Bacillaceae bacterium Marseille-Q3522]|nr:LysE family translocator [Bacillaceae bacterium Marseille-Q3522]
MAFCLIILPGPDTVIITKNTLQLGTRGGIQTCIGTCIALGIHTLAAIIGLSALLVKSAVLFSIFKFAGAVYLIYLGIKAIWSIRKQSTNKTLSSDHSDTAGNMPVFRQGFFTNLLNPKVAVFFLTFLPQFLNPDEQEVPQFLLMGITYIVLTAGWFLLYILFIEQISAFMKKRSTERVMQGVTGVVLIGFGIKLAFEKA